LPDIELTEEETEDIDNLEKRLKLYQRIKELSRVLKNNFGTKILFRTSQTPCRVSLFAPGNTLNTQNLAICIQEVIRAFPKKELVPNTTVQKVVSLEEMIQNLQEKIHSCLSMRFSEFTSANEKKDKIHIVVSFLAILELVKQGLISVKQDKSFADMHIETRETVVPRYY
jgi:segregation and condensation protein A